RFPQSRGIAPGAEHLERASPAVKTRLGSADQMIAFEQRQDVVAELALRLRHVHLEPVVEAEQRFGSIAVVDEAVERGEERDAIRDGAVSGLRMCLPAVAGPPYPHRSPQTVLEQPFRLTQRERLGLRIPALGEVPQPLATPAADDGDLAVDVKRLEHAAHVPAPVPP